MGDTAARVSYSEGLATPPPSEKNMTGGPVHAEHGAPIDHQVPQDDGIEAGPDLLRSRIRHTPREPFAEFFSVFILILFGDGVVCTGRPE